MVSMADKRQALLDLIQQLATAQGVPFAKTRFRADDLLLGASANLDRAAILGRPISYLRVSWVGAPDSIPDSGAPTTNWQGQQTQVPHSFRVVIKLEYEHAEAYEDSSQYRFDRLLEGTDNPEGLLPYFRRAPAIEIGGQVCELSRPQDLAIPTLPEPIEPPRLYAHYAEFTITITSSII